MNILILRIFIMLGGRYVRVRGVRSVAPKYLILQAHDRDREKDLES